MVREGEGVREAAMLLDFHQSLRRREEGKGGEGRGSGRMQGTLMHWYQGQITLSFIIFNVITRMSHADDRPGFPVEMDKITVAANT